MRVSEEERSVRYAITLTGSAHRQYVLSKKALKDQLGSRCLFNLIPTGNQDSKTHLTGCNKRRLIG